jgi:hypothetical protein
LRLSGQTFRAIAVLENIASEKQTSGGFDAELVRVVEELSSIQYALAAEKKVISEGAGSPWMRGS